MWTRTAVFAGALACTAEAFVGGAPSLLLSRVSRDFAIPYDRAGVSARSGVVTLRAIGQKPSENKLTTDEAWDSATAFKLEVERCGELQDIFNKFDYERKGGLDAAALRGALEEVRGATVTLDNAQQIVAALDLNGDGVIDFQEFQQACPCKPQGIKREE